MASADDRQIRNVSTYFFVSDLVRAAEFYRDKLGFDRYWGEPPCFVMVRRDGVQFMLRSGLYGGRPQPNRALDCDTWDAYVYVRDADGLHAEFAAKGVDIVRPPEDQEYGCRDFEVRDPDGYVICFGQDLQR
jgi:catechol 2,3-dioxygenase-like lactoylglutathione lyase family enzyme